MVTINTIEDLDAVRENLSGVYELANDLDFNDPDSYENSDNMTNYTEGAGFEPIGTEADPFTGGFTSNSYKIYNLYIDRPETNQVGLFGVIDTGSNIQAQVRAVSISGGEEVGGVVAKINTGATVEKSSTVGNVRGNDNVGGVVGVNNGTADQLWARATIISDNGNIGGTMGRNNSALTNSYALGSVSGGRRVGGLVGHNTGTLDFCFSASLVLATEQGGGLCGDGLEADVTNSFWDTEESGFDTSYGGTGKTSSELQDVDTYTDQSTEGLDDPWDFVGDPGADNGSDDYWTMPLDLIKNDGYPYLNNIGSLQEYILTADTVGTGEIYINNLLYEKVYHVTSGDNVLLTTETDQFWSFTSWGGDLDSTEAELLVVIDSDLYVTATFEFLPELDDDETYATATEALKINTERGRDEWSTLTVREQEQALRIATSILNEFRWAGEIASADQYLAWPRENVVDSEGREIDETTIPQIVKEACAELAYIHAFVTELTTQATGSSTQVKAGKLTIDYDESSDPRKLKNIKKMLRSLIRTDIKLQRR